MNTSEGKLEIESDQPPPTPGMFPIRRPEKPSLIPHCSLNETKLSFVLDKTQERGYSISSPSGERCKEMAISVLARRKSLQEIRNIRNPQNC